MRLFFGKNNEEEKVRNAIFTANRGTNEEKMKLLETLLNSKNFDVLIAVTPNLVAGKNNTEIISKLWNYIIQNKPDLLEAKSGNGVLAASFIGTKLEDDLWNYIKQNNNHAILKSGKGSDNFAYQMALKGNDKNVIDMINWMDNPQILATEAEGESSGVYDTYTYKTHVINLLASRNDAVLMALVKYVEKVDRLDLLKLKSERHQRIHEPFDWDNLSRGRHENSKCSISAIEQILIYHGGTNVDIELLDYLTKKKDKKTLYSTIPEFFGYLHGRPISIEPETIKKMFDYVVAVDPNAMRLLSVENDCLCAEHIDCPIVSEPTILYGKPLALEFAEATKSMPAEKGKELQRLLAELASKNASLYQLIYDAITTYGYSEIKPELYAIMLNSFKSVKRT